MVPSVGVESLTEEPSEEVVAYAKLLAALVEHSSEWLVDHIQQSDVQAFLGLILHVAGWAGTGGVDENVSEVRILLTNMM